MPRLFLKLTVTLSLLLGLLVGLSQALPYDESYSQALRQFLLPDENCSDLCFMGISRDLPYDQIMQLLQTHDWVGAVAVDNTIQGSRSITWDWNGQQPAFIRASEPGSLLIVHDREIYSYVASVSLYSNFTLGDLWLALGAPDTAFVWQHYVVKYAEGGFLLRMVLDCRHFWQAGGLLAIGSRDDVEAYDLHHTRQNVCLRTRGRG